METEEKLQELEQKYNDLEQRHEELLKEFQYHRHTGFDTRQIDGTAFEETPFEKVTNPSDAGLTYNQATAQEAVDAINSIITILETLKVTSDQ